jgi:hypothetical protein
MLVEEMRRQAPEASLSGTAGCLSRHPEFGGIRASRKCEASSTPTATLSTYLEV